MYIYMHAYKHTYINITCIHAYIHSYKHTYINITCIHIYVTGPAKINHVSANFIFSLISSALNVVSQFRKFQKKVH